MTLRAYETSDGRNDAQPVKSTNNAVHTVSGAYTALGVSVVTVTSTAATLATLLSAAIPAGANRVAIQPRGGDVRFTDDGQNPTTGAAGLGIDIYDGTYFQYPGTLSALKLIASTNTTCVLAFYR